MLGRAHEIIRLLSLTPENVDLFEDCERISHAVAAHSFPSFEGGDILETCRWVHRLHESFYKERIPRYLAAAKDLFSKLPVKGDTRSAITDYHQLELLDEIGDEELASVTDENVRQTLKAMRVRTMRPTHEPGVKISMLVPLDMLRSFLSLGLKNEDAN